MKIAYLGNFLDPGFEGLRTIVEALRKSTEKKHTVIVNEPETLDEVDIAHIHSNGFFLAVKYRTHKFPVIYSLHTNITTSFWDIILEQIDYYTKFYSMKSDNVSLYRRLRGSVLRILSQLTPLFVKKHYLNKMDVVIVANQVSKTQLGLNNVRVIHQGIDLKKFSPGSRRAGKLRVAYFGHPTTAKGVIEVVDAFSKISDVEKRVYFTHVNDGVREYISKKDSEIVIHGFVKDIVKAYNEADIIVLPLRHALGAIATPLTLIEAMACGKAVITSDLPHLRELCGEGVHYVKPYDTEGLLDGINELREGKKRELLGKKAREVAEQNFDIKEMMAAYSKLYEEFA